MRLQNKRKKVEKDKPHFRKATNVVQTREHKTPSATRENNVMKSTDVRDGPLENLWGGRAKYKKKYSHKAKLNEKKFMHAN